MLYLRNIPTLGVTFLHNSLIFVFTIGDIVVLHEASAGVVQALLRSDFHGSFYTRNVVFRYFVR